MRTVPISDDAVWPGGRRVVIAAPDGDLTNPQIASVEAVMDLSPSLGLPRYSVRCAMEPGDIERLAVGGHVWVSFYGAMAPFSVEVKGPTAPAPDNSPEAVLARYREGQQS